MGDFLAKLVDKMDPVILTWSVVGIVSAVLLILLGLVITAYFQGREISLWGYKIAPRSEKSEAETSIVPSSPEIIEDASTRKIYLVEDGYRRHIPDSPTLEYLGEYLGFGWEDAKLMGDEIKDIPSGIPLPKIWPHCKKYEVGLTIHRAMWGAKGVIRDVTRKVSRLASDGKLDLAVNIDMLGNPIQETKWLVVAYSYNGELNIETVVENGRLILP